MLLCAVTFRTKPRNTTVVVGKSAVLRCNASGIPEPGISWRKEHGGLDKKRFRQLSNGNLHIKDAHKTDSGGYFCVAITKGDLKEIKATLRVVGMTHRFQRWNYSTCRCTPARLRPAIKTLAYSCTVFDRKITPAYTFDRKVNTCMN